MPVAEITSKGLDELRMLSYQEMQPIERLKKFSLGLPKYFDELKQILAKNKGALPYEQKQLFLMIVEKIIELLEQDHKDLIEIRHLEAEQSHDLKQGLQQLKSLSGVKKMLILSFIEKDELRLLKTAIRNVCKMLDSLHKMRNETIGDPHMENAGRFIKELEYSMNDLHYFFLEEAKYIGKIELDHARARQLLTQG